ncbi:hypothetical protein QW060_09540 [Myroides ceti]|uniref:Uncharacterized protein n=1 Tax=Paenimyroides ceti TaxID=395087 RepID=A0ABT8CS75_9FLAO|nr:hypothetical protein [Paenimyroides ceti]MDN3707372.1 hypothetical protein [Paenimyroides ceti]
MNKDRKKIPGNDKNKNTSPTDIKGKDSNEANQTNSGAGGSPIKEGSNLLPEDTDKVDDQNTKKENAKRKDNSEK